MRGGISQEGTTNDSCPESTRDEWLPREKGPGPKCIILRQAQRRGPGLGPRLLEGIHENHPGVLRCRTTTHGLQSGVPHS